VERSSVIWTLGGFFWGGGAGVENHAEMIGKIEVKNHDQPGFPTKKQDYEKNKTRSKSNSVLFGSGLEHGRCSS
jgi:hypothetical protein